MARISFRLVEIQVCPAKSCPPSLSHPASSHTMRTGAIREPLAAPGRIQLSAEQYRNPRPSPGLGAFGVPPLGGPPNTKRFAPRPCYASVYPRDTRYRAGVDAMSKPRKTKAKQPQNGARAA